MTIKLLINGTQSWYRTDSYWNSAATKYASTWGPGLEMSTNWKNSTADNNGTDNLGKTFVFAYSDGSGIQFNHLTFGTAPPTSNTTAGSGSNKTSTAPTSYSNDSPNRVEENKCITTDLLLAGTANTSSLASVITDFSDGYKATWTINLQMFLNGAAGGWRGACIVYYTSQYVQSAINGSICFIAVQSTATGAGPTDFGSGVLLHVPTGTWSPPAKSADVTPTANVLSGDKYGIGITPSAATQKILTDGFYASASWYQPKYASSYKSTEIARYGKNDWHGTYCIMGSGSTSYFSAVTATTG
jgi:hypothetical protein